MKKKPKIFYAEDMRVLRQSVAMMLKLAGYRVDSFEDGVDLMLKLKDDAACDVVVTDNDMPVMMGMEVLRGIKSNPAWQHMPVIVFSGNDAIRQQVTELGGVFVDKGNIDPLLEAIAKVMSRAAA